MIGVSLPFMALSGISDVPAHQALLAAYDNDVMHMYAELRALGVESVELRAVNDSSDPEMVLRAAQECAQSGLRVTIHGGLNRDCDIARFLRPYGSLLSSPPQTEYIIVVHALSSAEATIKMLKGLMAYSGVFRFALENDRRKDPESVWCSCEQLAAIADAIGDPHIGVCWDFGHFYYNDINYNDNSGMMPPEDFCARAIQTHIHGVGNKRTHHPLWGDNLPLERYCSELRKHKYTGAYNLELDFPRFYPNTDPRAALEHSIAELKRVLECNID